MHTHTTTEQISPGEMEQARKQTNDHAPRPVPSRLRHLISALDHASNLAREICATAAEQSSDGAERYLAPLHETTRCGELLSELECACFDSRIVTPEASGLLRRIREVLERVEQSTEERNRALTDLRNEEQRAAGVRREICKKLPGIINALDRHGRSARGPLGIKAMLSHRAQNTVNGIAQLQDNLRKLRILLEKGELELSTHSNGSTTPLPILSKDIEALSREIGISVSIAVRPILESIHADNCASAFVSEDVQDRYRLIEKKLEATRVQEASLAGEAQEFLGRWSTLVVERWIPKVLADATADEEHLRLEKLAQEFVTAMLASSGLTPPYNDPGRRKFMLERTKFQGWEDQRDGVRAHASVHSYENIRESLRLFFRYHVERRGEASATDILRELQREVESVRESSFIEYRCSIASFPKILASRSLRPLMTLLEYAKGSRADQSNVFASSKTGIYMNDHGLRQDAEGSLLENERALYGTLNTTTKPVDDDVTRRPGYHYGPVRFIFDWDAIASKTVFTESDSLNYSGLSPSIRAKKNGDVKGRQLVAPDVFVSQAILQQDIRHFPEESLRPQSNLGYTHRYIEAQIMTHELKLDGNVRGILFDFRGRGAELFELARAYPNPVLLREQIERVAPGCRVSSLGVIELSQSHPERAKQLRAWGDAFPEDPSFKPG